MKKLHINIEGMHCGACATGIQMLLSSLDGVSGSFIDYDKKFGDVEFDEGKIDKGTIFKNIEELGYKVSE